MLYTVFQIQNKKEEGKKKKERYPSPVVGWIGKEEFVLWLEVKVK